MGEAGKKRSRASRKKRVKNARRTNVLYVNELRNNPKKREDPSFG